MNADKRAQDMETRRARDLNYRSREYEGCYQDLGPGSWRTQAALRLMCRATYKWSLAAHAVERILSGGRISGRPSWMG